MPTPDLSITWSVEKMEVDSTEENTVLSVHYICESSFSEDAYTESTSSSYTVEFDSNDIDTSNPDFVDYNDLTESQVLSWLDGYQFPFDTETHKQKFENRIRNQHNLRFSKISKQNPWG